MPHNSSHVFKVTNYSSLLSFAELDCIGLVNNNPVKLFKGRIDIPIIERSSMVLLWWIRV